MQMDISIDLKNAFGCLLFSITANSEIEPIPIHPQLGGIETIKQKQNEKHEHNVRNSRRQQGYHSGESN